MAMAPMAQQGLLPASANQANNNAAGASSCDGNQSSLLFIQQVSQTRQLAVHAAHTMLAWRQARLHMMDKAAYYACSIRALKQNHMEV